MTILQMEYFVAVANQGSFSKAAEKLFVSQKGISKQIRAIESELGITLIDRRNKRRVQLTKGFHIRKCMKRLCGQFHGSVIKTFNIPEYTSTSFR